MGFIFIIPAIVRPKKFFEAMDAFLNSGDTTLRIAALVNFLIAFLVLNTRWSIKGDVRSIMAVFGYLLVLRGIVWLWFPSFFRNMMKKALHSEYGLYVMTFFGLVFALGMGYLGWWVY